MHSTQIEFLYKVFSSLQHRSRRQKNCISGGQSGLDVGGLARKSQSALVWQPAGPELSRSIATDYVSWSDLDGNVID